MNIQLFFTLFFLAIIHTTGHTQNNHTLPLMHHLQMQNTNKVEAEVDRLYVRMQKITSEKSTYKPLYDKAQQLNNEFVPLKTTIDELQTELLAKSGGIYSQKENINSWKYKFDEVKAHENPFYDGFPVGAAKTAPVKEVLIESGKGKELIQEIIELKQQSLEMLDKLSSFCMNLNLQGVRLDYSEIDKMKEALYLADYDISVNYFENMSVGEAAVFLRQIELEITQTYVQLLNIFAQEIGNKSIIFDRFDVFSETACTTVKKGEPLEINLGLATYSSMANVKVKVDGKMIDIEDGKAAFRIISDTVGEHSYEVKISFRNELTGRVDQLTKEYKYTVIE